MEETGQKRNWSRKKLINLMTQGSNDQEGRWPKQNGPKVNFKGKGSLRGCGGSRGDVEALEGMWWLSRGCGGWMVVHQTVKPAVLGSNPASLQPAGTCHSLMGSQQGWHDNCRLASEGRQRQKIKKYQKFKEKQFSIPFLWDCLTK